MRTLPKKRFPWGILLVVLFLAMMASLAVVRKLPTGENSVVWMEPGEHVAIKVGPGLLGKWAFFHYDGQGQASVSKGCELATDPMDARSKNIQCGEFGAVAKVTDFSNDPPMPGWEYLFAPQGRTAFIFPILPD